MRVQLAQPVASPEQLVMVLRSMLPRYEYSTRAGGVVVGNGLVTGVYAAGAWGLPARGLRSGRERVT